jgi:hypothetical protein
MAGTSLGEWLVEEQVALRTSSYLFQVQPRYGFRSMRCRGCHLFQLLYATEEMLTMADQCL